MKLAPRSYLTIWHAIHKLASLSSRFIGESKATANGKHTCMSPLWNFRAFPPPHPNWENPPIFPTFQKLWFWLAVSCWSANKREIAQKP